jgi:hypothetical protein
MKIKLSQGRILNQRAIIVNSLTMADFSFEYAPLYYGMADL